MEPVVWLVQRARQGDREAFARLVEDQRVALIVAAHQMVGDWEIARELAQEAILQAYLSLPQLRQDGAFRSWLYGITLNLCRSYRRAQPHELVSLESLSGGRRWSGSFDDEAQPDPESVFEARELRRQVLQAVNNLTAAEREAVVLFYYNSLTTQEAAALLGISSGALRVRLHKARQRLKQALLLHNLESMRQVEEKQMIAVEVLEVMNVMRQVEWQPQPVPNHILLLLDEAGGRVLPIWIGTAEAFYISNLMNSTPFPRPMTLDFLQRILEAAGVSVESVMVNRLLNDVFYAVAQVRSGGALHSIDARPSDAIGLAVLRQAPVYVAESILQEQGVVMGEQFRASLPERRRMRSLKAEDLMQLVPPSPDAAPQPMPSPEQMRADHDRSRQMIQEMVGQ